LDTLSYLASEVKSGNFCYIFSKYCYTLLSEASITNC